MDRVEQQIFAPDEKAVLLVESKGGLEVQQLVKYGSLLVRHDCLV